MAFVSTVFTYNPWNVDGGRLLNLTTTRTSDSAVLQNATYDYDSVGNILTIVDSLSGPQTQTFQYDELDRVTNSAVTGGTDGLYTEAYSFETGTGNLKSKNGATYTYDATRKHAVTQVSNQSSVNSYQYDQNGNMTDRYIAAGPDAGTYEFEYDAENRMIRAEKNSALIGQFFYDADGKQVKTIVNGVTTSYVGNHYEVKDGAVTKYYFVGATRLAVRHGTTLNYLLSDHLGSSSVTTDENGIQTAQAMYKTFGETRYFIGDLKTDYTFTGQREEASLGLYFFVSRWLDPSLGRFTSPDTIVPTSTQGTQAWDRYAFVNNNPVRYTDPTGHMVVGDEDLSHEKSHSDPCAVNGYDSPECKTYLNLPEPPPSSKLDDIVQKDDDATQEPELPAPPEIDWQKVGEGTLIILLMLALDIALVAGVVAFAPEIFTVGELLTIFAMDGIWIILGSISLVDVHIVGMNLLWEGFTGEKDKIPLILFEKFKS